MKLLCHWLEYPTGVRKVLGSIPPGDSGFFFVLCSWHVHHIISHRTSHVTNLITMRKISCPRSLAFLFVTCKVRPLTPALHSKISIVCHSRCIWKSWCLRRGKKNRPYSLGVKVRTNNNFNPHIALTSGFEYHICGRRVFSPLGHPCYPVYPFGLPCGFVSLHSLSVPDPGLEIRGVGGRHPDP